MHKLVSSLIDLYHSKSLSYDTSLSFALKKNDIPIEGMSYSNFDYVAGDSLFSKNWIVETLFYGHFNAQFNMYIYAAQAGGISAVPFNYFLFVEDGELKAYCPKYGNAINFFGESPTPFGMGKEIPVDEFPLNEDQVWAIVNLEEYMNIWNLECSKGKNLTGCSSKIDFSPTLDSYEKIHEHTVDLYHMRNDLLSRVFSP